VIVLLVIAGVDALRSPDTETARSATRQTTTTRIDDDTVTDVTGGGGWDSL
jgi:hypothetical protein